MEIGNRARTVAQRLTATVGVAPGIPLAIGRLFASLNLWFWVIVGLPTLGAAVYYFAIASDMYVSVAEFNVHGPLKLPALSAAASLLGGGSIAGSDETPVVRDYILSRDAAQLLEVQDDLPAVLSRPEGDLFSRFPGVLFWRKDFEALYRAYGKFVTVDIDAETGIATLEVKAYRPADAKRVASALLAASEQLINDMNSRARDDALRTFQKEVDECRQRLDTIQNQLTAYRVKANMLEPTAEAKGPMTLLADLNKQEAETKAQLADATRNAPHSPQIGLLKTRLSSLDKLISDEREKITGSGNSVATATTQYEILDLQRQMEEKLLAAAVAAREQARLEVQRQQLYLETIARPNLPDYPLYPKRITSFATVVASCLLAYGIVWLLVAGVREHASA